MKNNSFRKVSTSRAAIGRTDYVRVAKSEACQCNIKKYRQAEQQLVARIRAGCEKRDLSMQHRSYLKNNSFRKVSTSRAAIGRTERAGCEKQDLSIGQLLYYYSYKSTHPILKWMGAFYLQLSTLYIDFSIITTLKSNKTAKKLNIEKFP